MSSIPADAVPLPGGISASALSSLFGAINGLRNRRALIAMIACLVGGVDRLRPAVRRWAP
jgi:hypothetical protein